MSARSMQTKNIIGRRCAIRVNDEPYEGTVVDSNQGMAKRIRIQSKGKRQGDVVQPWEYIFMEFLD